MIVEIEESTNDTDKAVASIRRSVANMNKKMLIIKKQFPDANFYHSDNCINVMAGQTHDECGSPMQGDNILANLPLNPSDGGGW